MIHDFTTLASTITTWNIQRKLLVVGDGGSGGSTTGGTINTSSSSTTNNISDEPFFSPAMETELLMLATNFLLCKY